MNPDRILRNFPYKITLASASPRRRELLAGLGLTFTVKPVHADESFPPALQGREIALYLAALKADVYGALRSDELLITADTIVWCGGEIYNKPAGFDDGKRMLQSLSGRMHEVFTGVCIRTAKRNELFCDVSKVFFKPLSDQEIAHYLETCKPYDKAGAYGVQEWIGYIAIDRIEGSFYNVMGLPVKMVYEHLMKFVE